MSTIRSSNFSNCFAISCGTVTVDMRLMIVLCIKHRPTGEWMLPKGRKNIGETLEQTALRETKEETGEGVKLLEHPGTTLATDPDHEHPAPSRWTTEPFAVHQRVTDDGVRKIIFWYLAEIDPLEPRGLARPEEDFEVHWMLGSEAARRMAYEEDRQLVIGAMALAAEIKNLTSKAQ